MNGLIQLYRTSRVLAGRIRRLEAELRRTVPPEVKGMEAYQKRMVVPALFWATMLTLHLEEPGRRDLVELMDLAEATVLESAQGFVAELLERGRPE